VLVFFLALFVVVAALISAYAFVSLVIYPNINRDVVSGVDVINAGGSKTALVVYQPGYTSFPRDVSYAFADGLASSGWRVEITTASSQAPSELSGYSLLVLGFPIYGGKPGDAIVRYVNGTSNLNGISTVIIAVGAFSPGEVLNTMTQKVHAANGTVKESMALFSIAPNKGNGYATDIARQAGSQIAP